MSSSSHTRRRLGSLPLGFVLGLAAAGLAQACTLPNPDHCLHRAIDSNAWCAGQDAERPFCSPCAADFNGCVAEEPTPESCPSYSAPAPDTGSDSGTDDETDGGDESGGQTEGESG